MTTFDDREQAFEAKFAHDEELAFKAQARRDKLMGMWVADLLGLTGDDAQAYAKTVVMADLAEPGDEDVLGKLRSDLDAAGKNPGDAMLRAKLEELHSLAKRQLMTE
ncbi:MAG TPA: DUF1476 domain-containing protein [Hyphomonadaceae bacterium]|nr:DUF1476 domain-containing protein [Hyphomonadaceae bacterium]